jgi:hypothetical protein
MYISQQQFNQEFVQYSGFQPEAQALAIAQSLLAIGVQQPLDSRFFLTNASKRGVPAGRFGGFGFNVECRVGKQLAQTLILCGENGPTDYPTDGQIRHNAQNLEASQQLAILTPGIMALTGHVVAAFPAKMPLPVRRIVVARDSLEALQISNQIHRLNEWSVEV